LDDPEQEHFTDGITDDIITGLAKIGGLAVVARNSAFTYKNRAVKRTTSSAFKMRSHKRSRSR
jgi:TolB-like protein